MKMDISLIDTVEDLNALIDVFDEVFGNEVGERPADDYIKNLLSQQTFRAITAKVDGEIVGGLTLYILDQYYSPKPLAYIYDLAVSGQFQRKGIGRRLIEFTNKYCRDQGFEEVFVQADKVDLFALDFYRATNPSFEEPVVHFTYRLDDIHGN